jgi:hypothetical protein
MKQPAFGLGCREERNGTALKQHRRYQYLHPEDGQEGIEVDL